MCDKIIIELTEEQQEPEEMAHLLRFIANQIDAGYTSGYQPTWDIMKKKDE